MKSYTGQADLSVLRHARLDFRQSMQSESEAYIIS
jgi:hypothetical protein